MATTTTTSRTFLTLRQPLQRPLLSSLQHHHQQHRPHSGHTKKAVKHDRRPLKHTPRKSGVPRDHQLMAAKKTQYHETHPSPPSTQAPPTATPQPILAPTLQQTQPTEHYFIARTPTRNLPVYQESKRGGNLKQTRVRKVSGQTAALVAQLTGALEPRPEWIRVNGVTGHVEMKGWYKGQVEGFLVGRGF